jgi:hypothetical protein
METVRPEWVEIASISVASARSRTFLADAADFERRRRRFSGASRGPRAPRVYGTRKVYRAFVAGATAAAKIP